MEPEKLLADYHARVAGIAQRAQAARAQIASVRGIATSADGAVTVSVNVQGALEDLSFGSAADTMSLPDLARTVLSTSRRARIRAASAGADALVPLIGADSAAMDQVRCAPPQRLLARRGCRPPHPGRSQRRRIRGGVAFVGARRPTPPAHRR